MAKPIVYKEEDGTKYKISYSEELQLKNLKESKKIRGWLQINFYSNLLLIVMLAILTITFLYLLWQLDSVNFFSNLLRK